MIALADLAVRLGGRNVLDGLTAQLPDGAFALVLGSPGSGKSTLLKTICGLLVPDRGAALVDGQDLARLPPDRSPAARARVGMVFQNDALFDSLPARENVMAPLLRRGVGAAEASARAEEALEAVGLFAAADRLPAALSGGMRKRLGLARALVTTPRHLLLDDPIAGLDPVTAARIVRRIDLARQRAGGVVIAVGFDDALLAAATHLLVLEDGRIAAFGAPADARRAPEAERLLGAGA